MGPQSVPGIIKPYSKGVVQFLTKVPEKQKSKDSTLRNSANSAVDTPGPGYYEPAPAPPVTRGLGGASFRSTTPQRPEPSRSRVPPPGAYNTGRYGGQGVYGRGENTNAFKSRGARVVKPGAAPTPAHRPPADETAADSGFFVPRASGRPGARLRSRRPTTIARCECDRP